MSELFKITVQKARPIKQLADHPVFFATPQDQEDPECKKY
jgi:hypothetical protein